MNKIKLYKKILSHYIMTNIDEEEIDSSSSTVDLNRQNNRDEIRNKLLQDVYYENLELQNLSFSGFFKRNKILIYSFLFSVCVGIVFLIYMFYG